ncbi:unnamed protein product [Peniophora sp. CBMAI 1063]|nr:unnamed protein product [Peniophora sp. CBMAI 1063]
MVVVDIGPRALLSIADYDHAWTGIYVWEYITSLSYDWGYLTERKQRRWTTWIYLSCRSMTAISLFLFLAYVDIRTGQSFHCSPLYACMLACCYISFQLSTLPVVLRILVVWAHWPPIVIFAVAGWTSNLAIMLWSIVGASASWVQISDDGGTGGQCLSPYDARNNRVLEIVTFGVDTALVLCMIIGLQYKEARGPSTTLWNILHRQAFIWLGVILLAEVPAVVLTFVDLRDLLRELHLLPKLTIITISSSRMYRSLNSYLVERTGSSHRPTHAGMENTIALEAMGNTCKRAQPLVVNVHTEQIQYTSDADEATQEASRRALRHRNRYYSRHKAASLSARDIQFL